MTDSDFSPERPERTTPYQEVVGAFRSFVPRYKQVYTETHGREFEGEVKNVAFEGPRVPIELPTVGADELIIKYVDSGIDNHGVAVVQVELFEDGSPRVADDDLLDDGHSLSNTYLAIFGELPPALLQFNQLPKDGILTGEAVRSTNMHRMSEKECEALIGALKAYEAYIYEQMP